jgi:hypothetical protein
MKIHTLDTPDAADGGGSRGGRKQALIRAEGF